MSELHPDTPAVYKGWTDSRVKRARVFAAVLVAAAIAALWTVNQPWFAWATAGAPSCDPAVTAQTVSMMTSTGVTVDGIYAAGCQTGADIVDVSVSPVGAAAGVAQAYKTLLAENKQDVPAGMFGMPRAVALLIGCAALGALGLAMRNGLISTVALLAMYKPYNEFGELRELMLSGNGGSLTVAQSGAEIFGYVLLLSAAVLLTGTAFVVMINAAERKHAVALAEAKGEPKPPSVYDHVASFLGGKIATVLDATERARATNAQTSSKGA